jgi:hypothetical protein
MMPILDNARYELFAQELAKGLVSKLSALREIAATMGWDKGQEVLSEDEYALALDAASVLTSDASPIEKAACAAILDMLVSGWRGVAPPTVLGCVLERDDPLVSRWRTAVLSHDNHRCVECGSQDALHAHHIVRWIDAPSLRIVPENGTTLCQGCHAAVHSSRLNLNKAQSSGPRR